MLCQVFIKEETKIKLKENVFEGAIMEKDVLEKYKMNSREEAVTFLKSLWNEAPQPCPLCNGKLDFLHKKAKKNNSDWKCTGCGERYDAMKLLNLLNEGFGR